MRSFFVEQWHSQAVPTESPFKQRDFQMRLHSNRIKRLAKSTVVLQQLTCPSTPHSSPSTTPFTLNSSTLSSMASSSTPATTPSYARSLKALDRCLDRLPKDVNANPDDVRSWGEEFTNLLVSPARSIRKTSTNRFITASCNGRPSICRQPSNGRMA